MDVPRRRERGKEMEMSDEMLTEAQLREMIREILIEVSGAEEVLLERGRTKRIRRKGGKGRTRGETGWEKVNRAHTSTAKVQKRRRGDLEQEIDPNVSDVTKLKWKSKSAYASRVVNAMGRADGHVPIAADQLGISTRQLYRHLHDPAIIAAEPERASPGPDPEWNVEAGQRENPNEKDQARSRKELSRKAAADREERERKGGER